LKINSEKWRLPIINPKLKTAYLLSYGIVLLAVIASAGGIWFRSVYRDNDFVKMTWLGNDAVTLFLAVPILVAALIFSQRGSLKAQLVWMGVLDYMLYNYAFYLFGTAFNEFFLIYVALLGLSIFALIFGLANLDVNGISQQASERMPVRWIGGYFLFVAFGLGAVYLSQSIGFIFTGQVPSIVTISGNPTNIVFALDLTLLVPWLVLGALWLMKRRPWGFIITGILCVKGPLYTFVLTVNTLLTMRAGMGTGAELPLWVTLTVLGSITSILFYGNMKTVQK
jgi:hypothetical protein